MENQFLKTMSQHTDEKLIEILKTKEEYLPEAIVAAETEFNKRGISPERLKEIEAEVEERIERKKEITLGREEAPLEFYLKVLFFLFPIPIGILHIFLLSRYKIQGYKRKQKEAIEFIKFGFIFWGGLFLLGKLIEWLP